MSKVITFSRQFPSYHPRAGEHTFFEYKVARAIYDARLFTDDDLHKYPDFPALVAYGHPPKHHTIRAGHRWKAGDWFSPRVWSGKPYRSKQITFAPDIQIKKTWDFEIHIADIFLNVWYEYGIDFPFDRVAGNDGLTSEDFLDWFTLSPDFQKTMHFDGQIICWNENIEY